jgi:hypothetical protein
MASRDGKIDNGSCLSSRAGIDVLGSATAQPIPSARAGFLRDVEAKRHLKPISRGPQDSAQVQESTEISLISNLPETVPLNHSSGRTLSKLHAKKYILHSKTLDKLKTKIIIIDKRVNFDITAWCLKLREKQTKYFEVNLNHNGALGLLLFQPLVAPLS